MYAGLFNSLTSQIAMQPTYGLNPLATANATDLPLVLKAAGTQFASGNGTATVYVWFSIVSI